MAGKDKVPVGVVMSRIALMVALFAREDDLGALYVDAFEELAFLNLLMSPWCS